MTHKNIVRYYQAWVEGSDSMEDSVLEEEKGEEEEGPEEHKDGGEHVDHVIRHHVDPPLEALIRDGIHQVRLPLENQVDDPAQDEQLKPPDSISDECSVQMSRFRQPSVFRLALWTFFTFDLMAM